jgi:transposase
MDAKRKQTTEGPALNWRNKARRRFSAEERRAMVEECQAPGASVSEVALRHGVNTNQLFKWRRQHMGAAARRVALLPVTIEASEGAEVAASSVDSKPSPAEQRDGSIEIELGGARIRLHGAVDPQAIRAVVLALTQR